MSLTALRARSCITRTTGQHPSLNAFYQMMTMFDISVDQFFFPEKYPENSCRKRIDVMLNSLGRKGLAGN